MIPTLAALVLAFAERIPTLRVRRLPLRRPQLAGDVLYLLTGYVALGALGLTLVRAASAWVAARLDLGWTAMLHRLHHVPATTEHNFGTVLSTWDRLAGRLIVRDVGADTPLGLPRARATYPRSWLAQLRAPFDRAVQV